MGTDFLYHNGIGLSNGHADWSNGFVFLVLAYKNYTEHFFKVDDNHGKRNFHYVVLSTRCRHGAGNDGFHEILRPEKVPTQFATC